ncbi:MAG TPA: helix-turn-helix domain-containing protein [Mycobacteriales bacterium]|nr:helix-turn-helix domain-containing protein [Mycobacteriales bacterium]
MVADRTNGPVGAFCAELAELQRRSGLSRTALARALNYGRSQLYEILDGRIKRPPEWDRLVEPLVRTCLARELAGAGLDRAVADWRHRHEVLIRVHDELSRHRPTSGRRSLSEELTTRSRDLWPKLLSHPFVRAVSTGALDEVTFRRWMVNDHYFNVEYQRFVAAVAAIAPTVEATEAIALAIPSDHFGLDQIRRLVARSFVDVTAEPSLTAIGFTSFLHVQVSRGYPLALAALYAAERVYFDTWSSIRAEADRSTPYWHLIEHWSSEPYRVWISTLGRLVDASEPNPETYRVFQRLVRFEIAFFDAIFHG